MHAFIVILISTTLLLLGGCITGDEGISNTSDALVGVSMFKDGAPPVPPDGFTPPPGDSGPIRTDVGIGAPCQPGTRAGPCSLCGPMGRLEMPDDDAQCPIIDCDGGAGAYERVLEDDEVVCYQSMSVPRLPGRCAELGRCATAQDYCGANERVEQLRARVDPCNPMIGCEGIQPPELDTQAAGTECNRTGECNPDGVCSVQVPAFCRLDDTPDAKFYCGDGLENGLQYCEYFVEPPNDGRTRCIDFCQSLGMTICDQSAGEQCCWNNSNAENCERVQGIVCDGMPCDSVQGCRDMICRCYIPNN